MNDVLVLRAYIRESIHGLNEGPAGLLLPFLLSNPPGMEPEKMQTDLMLGKLGSFTAGSEPDYVIIADNPGENKLVIRKHSKSEKSPVFFQRNLSATSLLPSSPLLRILLDSSKDASEGRDVPIDEKTWWMLPSDRDKMKSDSVGSSPNKLGPGYYIVSRNTDVLVPQREYTQEFQNKVKNFECALDSWQESVEIIKTKDVKEPEWVLAAACFYEYANSFTPAVLGSVVGALLGAGIGAGIGAFGAGVGAIPGAGVGAKLGLMWGPALTDIALRGVAMWWAAYNGRTEFLYANAVYCVIILIFGAFATYTSKVLPLLKGPGGNKIAIKAIETTIAASPGLSSAFETTALSAAKGGVAILAEFISNVIATIFTGLTIEISKEKVELLISDTRLLDTALKDSEAQLRLFIQNQYPNRE
jgi:hypothetical protein